MRYLKSLPKMTRDQLVRLIAGMAIPPMLLPPESKPERVTETALGRVRIPHPRPHTYQAPHCGAEQRDPVPILRGRGARPQRR